MDIDGFGKSIIEKFHELGWLKSYPDIYRLSSEKISQLEGFGKKSAENLMDSIEKSKNNPIHRLIHALSIHHVGKKVSKLLAEEIESIFDLQHKTIEEIESIKDIILLLPKMLSPIFKMQKTSICSDNWNHPV
jgi:DNA ligase (NAD+)